MSKAGTAIGTSATVAQTFLNIQSIKAESKFQERILQRNAQIERDAGNEEFNRALDQALVLKRRAKRDRSTNLLNNAPLYILEENAANAELAALATIREGDIARNRRFSQSDIDLTQGRIIRKSVNRRVIGEALRGVGRVANQF